MPGAFWRRSELGKLLGGISGVFGFKAFGYGFTIPVAVLLAVGSLVPAWDDCRQ